MAAVVTTKGRLILASASPRRALLLRRAGYAFDIIKPPLAEPEDVRGDCTPAAQAEALSYFKARSVVPLLTAPGLIVGADTVVTRDGELFGKPADAEDARRILGCLTGSTHAVITGLTLLDSATGRRMIRHDRTVVAMRAMSPEEMDRYIGGGAWRGKAGAYGIQDRGDAFVERVEGSFTNVVGLPLELLARMLDEFPGVARPAVESHIE